MNAVLLDWRPKRTAHIRIATALKNTHCPKLKHFHDHINSFNTS